MDVVLRGQVPYAATFAAMQAFTATRNPTTPDLLWICEHESVYTQGLAGKTDHILNPGAIPVVQTDRGGQVTYHGPGQLVVYPLLDLKRRGLGVRSLVSALENAVSQVEKGAGRFAQVSGLTFTFDASAPPGSRVSEVMVAGQALAPDKLYKVAVNDYILGGGDGYTALGGGRIITDTGGGNLLASDVMAYVEKAGKVAPKVDGRIKKAGQ